MISSDGIEIDHITDALHIARYVETHLVLAWHAKSGQERADHMQESIGYFRELGVFLGLQTCPQRYWTEAINDPGLPAT